MMEIAIYARVSTRHQAQEQTIEQQLSRLQTHVAAQGWPLPPERIFRDDGYSGAALARPGLDALRRMVAEGLLEQVIITAPDRLTRNYVHQALLLEELRRCGCQVIFLDRPISEDPHDQLVLQIRGAVAEYERMLISERLRRGREAKLRAGLLLPWTSPPYGYLANPERPRDPAGIRPDPITAAVVQEIFAWYLEERGTLYSVAMRLGAAGVPSPTGQGHWSSAMVRRILRTPIYIGDPPRLSGRAQAKDTEPLHVHLPVLVQSEEFGLAAEKMVRNQADASRHNTTHPYLLRGRVWCGHCQLHATGCTRRGGSYYRCNGKANRSRMATGRTCPGRLMPAGQLDAVVWRDIVAVLTEPAQLQAALDRARQGAWLPQQVTARQDALTRARQEVQRQHDRLLAAYLASVVDLAEFERKTAEERARLRGLEAQQRQLDAVREQCQDLSRVAASLEAFCATVRTGLDRADWAQRRALIELLIERVVVTDEQVEIHYVMPLPPSTGTTSPDDQFRKGYLCPRAAPQGRYGAPLAGVRRVQMTRDSVTCREMA